MAFTITEIHQRQYLLLKVVGELSDTNIWSLHQNVAATSSEISNGKFLVDITHLQGRPDFNGSKKAVESIPQEVVGQLKKVAILDDIKNRTSAMVQETVMANRGLNVKFFFDKDSAADWLSK